MGKSPEIVRKMQKSKPRIVSARNFQGNSAGIRKLQIAAWDATEYPARLRDLGYYSDELKTGRCLNRRREEDE
jgi:hypothetical protein